jgi:HPt (histidine-containing phosphotransfer) domain-containing protein
VMVLMLSTSESPPFTAAAVSTDIAEAVSAADEVEDELDEEDELEELEDELEELEDEELDISSATVVVPSLCSDWLPTGLKSKSSDLPLLPRTTGELFRLPVSSLGDCIERLVNLAGEPHKLLSCSTGAAAPESDVVDLPSSRSLSSESTCILSVVAVGLIDGIGRATRSALSEKDDLAALTVDGAATAGAAGVTGVIPDVDPLVVIC